MSRQYNDDVLERLATCARTPLDWSHTFLIPMLSDRGVVAIALVLRAACILSLLGMRPSLIIFEDRLEMSYSLTLDRLGDVEVFLDIIDQLLLRLIDEANVSS
ncbi:hypothetical protein AAMO2058_000044700 [Amorphochlora amoebiformis]|mmetsp:Transcript_22691/g.35638  ORF Transcript_22691/g.35638 Transcript_22691/m.35638 type:complete len:103 (-) Transcript_22691:499-807(-)